LGGALQKTAKLRLNPVLDVETEDPGEMVARGCVGTVEVEVAGHGSYRLDVFLAPCGHDGLEHLDALYIESWRVKPDGSGAADAEDGDRPKEVEPIFPEPGDVPGNGDDEDEDEDEDEDDDAEFWDEDEDEDEDAPEDEDDEDEGEDDEDPFFAEGAGIALDENGEPLPAWAVVFGFSPQYGFLVPHPSGKGTYCAVGCGADLYDLPVGTPCPNCVSYREKGVLPPDPLAAVTGESKPQVYRFPRIRPPKDSDTEE